MRLAISLHAEPVMVGAQQIEDRLDADELDVRIRADLSRSLSCCPEGNGGLVPPGGSP